MGEVSGWQAEAVFFHAGVPEICIKFQVESFHFQKALSILKSVPWRA